MTAITRSVDAGVLTEVINAHTRPFHLVKLVVPLGTHYYSEGPAMTFESQSYLEGRVCVKQLSWSGETGQTCEIRIYNETGEAATMFMANQFAEASITVYFVYRKADGSFTVPVLYVVGGVETVQLTYTEVILQVTAAKFRSKYVPNAYVGDAGFNHLPAEGNVVFWNNSQYVLERAY